MGREGVFLPSFLDRSYVYQVDFFSGFVGEDDLELLTFPLLSPEP